MSANRRHRRGRVIRGRLRPLPEAGAGYLWDLTQDVLPECMRHFRNDSGRTIRAGEWVFLTSTGGILPFPLEPPLTPASMPYSWVNPNGEVVRIYRE